MKERSFLVVDTGVGQEIAHRLAQDGNKVWYYTPWQAPHPNWANFSIGSGFPFEKVLDFGAYIEQADYIIFVDNGWGGFAKYLRGQGKKVVAAGPAEFMEMDRIRSAQVMREMGIKTPEYTVVDGTDGVIQFFKQNDSPHFIKINTFRGDMETSKIEGADHAEVVMKGLARRFGPFSKTIKFILCKPTDGVMVGVDTFFDGSKFSSPRGFGLELNSINCLERFYEESPVFEHFLKMVTPFLAEQNYRGPLSVEGMYDGKDLSIIDWTCRFPFSQSFIYCEYLENFTDVMVGLAEGDCPRLVLPPKYYAIITITSDAVMDVGGSAQWMPIKVDQGARVRFRRAVKSGDTVFAVPRRDANSTVASVVGSGDSVEDAVNKASEEAAKVHVMGGEYDDQVFGSDGVEQIQNLAKLGVQF